MFSGDEPMKGSLVAKNHTFDDRLERNHLVANSGVEYATYGVNHAAHCFHDCEYCYARDVEKHWGRIASADEWVEVSLVKDAAEQVDLQLSRKRTKPDRIHLSFMTDPFMWDYRTGEIVPQIAEVTIALIKVINKHGIPVTVLTKGIYPDLDVGSMHEDNQYGITVVSLNDKFHESWESKSPAARDRIPALIRLAEKGAKTWASVEPYPTPNMDPDAANPLPLLEALGFIDKFIFGRMNYRTDVTDYLRTDPTFFERVAADVSKWCQANGKPLHIKKRTPLHTMATVNILETDASRAIRATWP